MTIPRPYALADVESHPRVWGHELWIVNGDYCGKLLVFKTRGLGTTLHYHREKAETDACAQGHFAGRHRNR